MEPNAKRRRWFQFSMRTLLIVTLLIGAGAAWLSSEIRRAKRQEAAVEALREGGATIIFAHERIIAYENSAWRSTPIIVAQSKPGPQWLRHWLGLDLFSRVASVEIRIDPKEDLPRFESQVALLADVPSVESVSLTLLSVDDSLVISDAVVDRIVALPNLNSLSLVGDRRLLTYPIQDGVSHDVVDLSEMAWRRLAEATSIESLSLICIRLNEQSLKSITAMTHLRELEVEIDGHLSDDAISILAGCDKLTRLHLVAKGLTEQSLPRIAALPDLTDLTLRMDLTNEAIRQLAGMRGLQRLKLLSRRYVSEDKLMPLAGLPNLKELEFVFGPGFNRVFEKLRQQRPDVEIVNDTTLGASD
jgi:hypothetical protein